MAYRLISRNNSLLACRFEIVIPFCSVKTSHKPPKVWKKSRKPLSAGRAPTKDFDYFKKNLPTEKDVIEAKVIYKTYNYLLQSLSCCFQEELIKKKDKMMIEETGKVKWDESSHHQLCMDTNDAENKVLREKRMSRINTTKPAGDVKKINLDQIRKEILEIELESKEWLTDENMLQKIEEAIDNPVNYNYSIDSSGMIVSKIAQSI